MHKPIVALLVAYGAAALAPRPAAAQAQTAEPACAYRTCALQIDPRWNGLALVRPSGAVVANLNFFVPRDIVPSLASAGGGDESSFDAARSAVRIRRVAATLTDAGLLLAGYVGVRSASAGRLRRSDVAAAVVGAAALTVSVPLQFSADAALSRAAWRFNAQFAVGAR